MKTTADDNVLLFDTVDTVEGVETIVVKTWKKFSIRTAAVRFVLVLSTAAAITGFCGFIAVSLW